MTPIHELLNRIRWDRNFGEGRFEIGFLDRHDGIIHRVAFADLTFPKVGERTFRFVDETGQSRRVPFHRIREVYRDGERIGHRQAESSRHPTVVSLALVAASLACSVPQLSSATVRPDTSPSVYPDGRPSAQYRLEAQDPGPVLRHGGGPGRCDELGARDVWVWEHGGTYSMHYDGAGTKGWLACLATSTDLVHWTKKGAVLELGGKGADDSASASYGVTFFDGKEWHMLSDIIGLPSVVQVGRRLAILYDGNVAEQMPTGVKSHMNRDVGLAWLDLPLVTLALR